MTRGRWIAAAPIALLTIGGWALEGRIRAMLFQPINGDLAHGTASADQKFNLYLAKIGKGPFPVVVFINGAAFQFGDNREPFADFVTGIEALNARAIAPASINYRMSKEAMFPAAVADSRSAVRCLRANRLPQNIDPDRIAVWGKSAGAYLAMMAGVGDQAPKFDDQKILPGVSSRVSSVVAMYGPTDFLRIPLHTRAQHNGIRTQSLLSATDDARRTASVPRKSGCCDGRGRSYGRRTAHGQRPPLDRSHLRPPLKIVLSPAVQN